jgi:hypothetical protein
VTALTASDEIRSESPAHIVLGLIAVLVALVFGGLSYARAIAPGEVPPVTKLVRQAMAPVDQVAGSLARVRDERRTVA